MAQISKKLLAINAVSLLTKTKGPSVFNFGPRIANSINGGPIEIMRIPKMNNPLVGSEAKLWTEVRSPERTMNVPSNDNENPIIASRTVQLLSCSLCSTTITECNNAVAASHGIRDAFSTGSQNHQPPHPSS